VSPFAGVLLALLCGATVGALAAAGPWLDWSLGLQRPSAAFPYLLSTGLVCVAGAGVWLLARRPWRRLVGNADYLMLFLLILAPQISMGARTDPSDLVLLVVLGVFAIRLALDPEFEILLPNRLLMLVFFAALVASVMVGGFGSLFSLLAIVKVVLTYYLVANLIRTRRHAFYAMWFLVVITSASALIGIVQEIAFLATGAELVGFIPEVHRKYMYNPTFLGVMLRVPALTGWYIVLANLLVVAILFLANLLMYGVIDRPRERRWAWWLLGLMSVGLFLTFSRSAELALFLGLALSIVVRWRHHLLQMGAAASFLAVVAFASGVVDKALDSIEEDLTYKGDLGVRIELLERGAKGFVYRHPWLGAGIGNAPEYTQNIDRWPVHNVFVLIADEVGIFGLLAFLGVIATTVFKLLGYWIRATSERDRGIIMAVLIALIALLINLQFHPSYKDFFIFLLFGLFEGVSRAFGTQRPLLRRQGSPGGGTAIEPAVRGV